jgi:hypothetical protein
MKEMEIAIIGSAQGISQATTFNYLFQIVCLQLS